MSPRELCDHAIHAVDEYRKDEHKFKQQEGTAQRKVTEQQLGELTHKNKKTQEPIRLKNQVEEASSASNLYIYIAPFIHECSPFIYKCSASQSKIKTNTNKTDRQQ